ncbi:MAG: hypothetical protein VX938_12075, partial [Myxococcota bacterium]|nr:hypothetical protein [Myxococcota bacterium]
VPPSSRDFVPIGFTDGPDASTIERPSSTTRPYEPIRQRMRKKLQLRWWLMLSDSNVSCLHHRKESKS